MTDEPALLRAIVGSPDDLTLRLIYADWCEEHGRAERAALVRGQCFLDPLLAAAPDFDSDNADPRYLLPFQLTPSLRESVLEPFRPLAEAEFDEYLSTQAHWYGIRRGFVEQVHLQGIAQLAAFLPHAARILARTPVQTLRLYQRYSTPVREPDHLAAELVRQLVAADGFERVSELDLSNHNLGEAAARALLA
ncbi:MAG: TIGR02996 domain-containing protein, partial [Gemmataceae bacterium]